MKHLSVLIPQQAGAVFQAPSLSCLLARGQSQPLPGGDWQGWLAAQFGLEPPLPLAALTHLADVGEAPGWCLRADPVHLHADLHQLLLVDGSAEDLSLDEAQSLVQSLNHHCEELGWRFEAPHPQRWYLKTPAPLDMHTHAPAAARGKDIRPFMPTGHTAREWSRRLTEIQMLLFEHPVNQAREARGALTVNSVWCWGEGELPSAAQPPGCALYAEEPLLQGLAALADVSCVAPPVTLGDCLAQGDTQSLVVLPGLDHTGPPASLEQDWFAPLLTALQRGQLGTLELLPGDGYAYRLSPWRAWQFWRRGDVSR